MTITPAAKTTKTLIRRGFQLFGSVLAGLTLSVHSEAQTTLHPTLPPSISSALSAAHIPQGAVAMSVQRLDQAQPALSFRASQPMLPASTIKLLTTYAALDLLGPAYTWRTEIRGVGSHANGVYKGTLYIKGGGDPQLTQEAFWLMLRQLRARGIRDIRGDIVLDHSLFSPAAFDPSAFDGKPIRAYNVGPDALILSWKALQLRITPDAINRRVVIWSQPEPTNMQLDNHLQLVDGPCGAWRDRVSQRIDGSSKPARLVLEGSFPVTCGEKSWSLSVLDHDQFVAGVFANLWEGQGGSFSGTVRSGTTPSEAEVLSWNESPPLAQTIRDINKWSNNVMARQLLLTLGTTRKPQGVSEQDGITAIREWMQRRGLAKEEVALENGSGLSRREIWTANGMQALLRDAWKNPLMPEYLSSLPVYGTDGTFRSRDGAPAVRGRAHLKGGTLDGVSALGGYVLDRKGRMWGVSFIVNHANAEHCHPVQDVLLRWIDEQP